jgi:hypothetical protein
MLGVTCVVLAGRAADADVTAAWQLVGRHLANDALAGLQKQSEHGSRETAFA